MSTKKVSVYQTYWILSSVCLWILLLKCINTTNALATVQSSLCNNCKTLKDCESYKFFLTQQQHKLEQQSMLFRIIKNGTCGFHKSEILVCCMLKAQKHIRNRHSKRDINKERWVWDSRPFEARDLKSSHEEVADRFAHYDAKSFKFNCKFATDVLDYKDPKTQLNCPHSFYEENYDSSKAAQDPFYTEYPFTNNHDDSNSNQYQHFNQHRHHYHRHEGYEKHNDNFHSEYFIGADLGSGGGIIEDETAIIYPDDKGFQGPVIYENTPTSKSTTRLTLIEKRTNSNLPSDKIALINPSQCGISVGTRIIGGMESSPGQFPWIARIAYLNKTSNRISYRCSGSVVSDLYVLTAAHCVVNLVGDLILSHVRLGDVELSNDCQSNPNNCKQLNTFAISDVIVHPNYDQPKYANDIALLKIFPNQNENNKVTPICLPLNDSTIMTRLIGGTGVVAGWSTSPNSEGLESNNLKVKFLRLPIVNTTECAINYAKYSENFNDPIVITPSQLCAQGQPMNDVCRGDSGGPFMDDGTSGIINSNGRYSLLGIVAFGPTTCGVSNFPGVYTRVSSFIEWIANNIT